MGMIKIKELNDIIAKNLYVGEGNQRRENENFWRDLSKEKFSGYESSTLLAELHKCDSDLQEKEQVYRLENLIDWTGRHNLSEMLDYISEQIELHQRTERSKKTGIDAEDFEEGGQ